LTKTTKIAVATFGRSDYGLLRNLLFEIQRHPELELVVIAAGSHYLDKFGNSIEEVRGDGHRVVVELDCISGSNEAGEIVQDTGRSISEFGRVLSEIQPGLVVLLGDRFETLTAATSALILGVPIAHLNGGELTAGAFDDSIRHAITKMASLHFVAEKEYEARVLQLGEQPDRVHNVGHLGLDSLRALEPMSTKDLESLLDFKLRDVNLLVTVHPETLSSFSPQQLIDSILGPLGELEEVGIVFTAPNPDPGHAIISATIRKFVEIHDNAVFVESMGHRAYLSLMLQSKAVVGNSSSGILEAPLAGIPSLNVGGRQTGRIMATSVHQCDAKPSAVRAALQSVLSSNSGGSPSLASTPSGHETVSAKIIRTIKQTNLSELNKKTFNDINIGY
jgi:GDP/UDP-N,N'-diacetylbacillosamine 2-epimerase (hydrolysing)